MLIFKKVSSRVIRCHQVSSGGEKHKGANRGKDTKTASNQEGNKGGKKSCRAEGAEVPVFLWKVIFRLHTCNGETDYSRNIQRFQ